jgi:hypothetical protein
MAPAIAAIAAMAAMTPVHEEMHPDTDQERQSQRQRAENMNSMFQPQKHRRYGQEYTQCKPRRRIEEGPFVFFVVCPSIVSVFAPVHVPHSIILRPVV